MGTFAGMFCEKACIVPEEKREEFAKRVEKVLRSAIQVIALFPDIRKTLVILWLMWNQEVV